MYRAWQAFVVRHFAGDVLYLGAGCVEKNNDALHAALAHLLAAATASLTPPTAPPRHPSCCRGAPLCSLRARASSSSSVGC